MEKENKKITSRIVIAVLILLFLIGIFSHLQTGDVYTGNNKETDFTSNEYQELQDGNVVIEASSGYTFSLSSDVQDVEIDNDKSNEYDEKVVFYLGDGTKLYESDYIEPGESIAEIKLLNNSVNTGVYKNAVVVYRFYQRDSKHTFINQCEFPAEFEIVE